ncbi:MAG: PorV/PorQ family protein [Elusimicrobiota bacterium]
MFLLLLMTFPVAAKQSAGTGGGAFLLIPVGVRMMGMGGAGVAVPSGANAVSYNPALAAAIRRTEMALVHQELFLDTALSYGAFSMPLEFRGVNELGGANVFAHAIYMDKGDIEVNLLNSGGSLASSENKSAGYDMAFGLGYAEYFFRGSFGLSSLEEGSHSLGIMVQGVQSNLLETYDAYAVAANVGYFGNFRRFGVGLSLLNIGSELQFLEEGDPLPFAARAGFHYKMALAPVNLLTAYDAVYQEKDFVHRAGLEMTVTPMFAVRGGYQFEPQSYRGGPSFGFGLNMGTMFFDYAFSWSGDLEDTHRALFGMRFGRLHR